MSDKHRNAAIRAATAAYIGELLPRLIEPIREVAFDHGYAVAVHGSLSNDIDLLAAPWREGADGQDKLALAVKGAVAGVTGSCQILKKGEALYGDKPHGRRAYTLSIWPLSYIDLSIMPPIIPPPKEPAE